MSAPLALLTADPTLAELAETANREHALAQQAGWSMVEHAINAGEALLAVRDRCSEGEWLPWVDRNCDFQQSTASNYMRIAHYRERVLEAQITGINDANAYLAGLPGPHSAIAKTGQPRFYGPEVRAEAQRLRDAGASYQTIAATLGITKTTAHHWLDPQYAEHIRQKNRRNSRRRKAEKEALAQREREQQIKRAVKKAGAATAEAYAMAERMQDVLAQAHRETEDSTARRHFALAGEHYRKMRDEIVRAVLA